MSGDVLFLFFNGLIFVVMTYKLITLSIVMGKMDAEAIKFIRTTDGKKIIRITQWEFFFFGLFSLCFAFLILTFLLSNLFV